MDRRSLVGQHKIRSSGDVGLAQTSSGMCAAAQLKAQPKVGVVVLGMGRSGTSAVTGMFVRAGFFAGVADDLMPANFANPAGYYENLRIVAANDQLLQRLGGDWFNPPSHDAELAASAWATPILRAEVERLVGQAERRPIAIKDPRIGVLMPVWDAIISDWLHPVLVIRDPIEIARSLSRRDGTPPAFGLAAWELHMTELLSHLDGRWVSVVGYAQLIESAEAGPRMIEAALRHVDPNVCRGVRATDGATALAPDLRHNRALEVPRGDALTGHQTELWEWLSSLPQGDQELHVPAELRRSSAWTRESVHLGAEWGARTRDRTQLALELDAERSQRAAIEAELTAERSQRAAIEADLAAERARGDELDRRVSDLDSAYQVVLTSRSWRITAPLRELGARLRRAPVR